MADSEGMMTSSSFRLFGNGVVGGEAMSIAPRVLLRLLDPTTSVMLSSTILSFLTLFGTPFGRPRFFLMGKTGTSGRLDPEA